MATLLKYTITPAGQGGDFNTIADAYAALRTEVEDDLVAANKYAEFDISGNWSAADTAAVNLNIINSDATHYLSIYTSGNARHAGLYSTSKYLLNVTPAAGDYSLRAATGFVRVDGLQVKLNAASANGCQAVLADGGSGSDFRFSNGIIVGNLTGTTTSAFGLYCGAGTAYLWNTLIYGFMKDNADAVQVDNAGTVVKVYCCTLIAGRSGIRRYAGTVTAKNCYAYTGTDAGAYYGSPTLTNCASNDDTGSASPHLHQIAYDTDTFVNVTGGSEDFHLAADGLSPLQGAGTDTSGDSAPLNFTTDIDGDTRDATWDIGADSWVVSGYTLACSGGSYSLSGTAASTLKASKLAAEGGEYALTGQAAGAYYGRKLAAEAGSYTLTGATAGLLRAAKLGAEAGEYALTGTAAATLYGRKLAAEAGEYTLTGQDIAALYGRLIAAEAGEYTLTGADATLLRTALLTAEAGEYALTGADIAALYGRLLVADAGEYAITGSDVALLRAALLTAEAGEYAWTGSDVTLLASAAGAYVLVAESGTYALTGTPVALLKTSKLAAEGGSYAVTGQDAATLVGRLLDAGAGAYAITGADATLLRDAVLAAEAGAYTLTGADVTLLVATINNYILTAESGSYALTGTAANLLKGSYGPTLKWAVGSSRLARSVGSSRLTKTRRSGLAGTNIREN